MDPARPADGLLPTNMTASEVIPDIFNPLHDQRFWCVPRLHDTPSESDSGSYPMYLVTQGRKVGIWYNWTVVKAMITGFRNGAYRGHYSVEGCIREWQLHCVLGVHPHPVDPQLARAALGPASLPSSSPTKTLSSSLVMMPAGLGRVVDGPLQAQLKQFCMPNIRRDADEASIADSSSISTCSSVTASDWSEVPASSRYFALWRGKLVYTNRCQAKRDFLRAEGAGETPLVLSTTSYDEAQAFSEGVHWVAD
ncbi:hypothetical protein C8R45DRAFT_1113801 [Mycena sanguinolenta]|nr:hypothetical protein C8R45DRAFT_1113801 [Mycena sanguinolenta]